MEIGPYFEHVENSLINLQHQNIIAAFEIKIITYYYALISVLYK